MYKVNVNSSEYEVVLNNSNSGKLNGEDFVIDSIEIKDGCFHVLHNNVSYNVELVKVNYTEKTFTISVNGNKYNLSVKDKFDLLLKNLGMDNLYANKINEIKAPMPGLVLDIRVGEGTALKKGDALLVLEAMKMENIIKCPADAVVKKIHIQKGIAVEKNQVLISFE